MGSAIYFLIPLLAIVTLGVLVTGVVSMIRGGEFNRKHGNRLMQLRVLFQALAVGLIALFMIFGSH